MEEQEINLRALSNEGKIWFTIRANDTEQNSNIHKAFKLAAKQQYNDDYTMALKGLLELADGEAKFEMMYEKMVELNERITKLENNPVATKEVEENTGTFWEGKKNDVWNIQKSS